MNNGFDYALRRMDDDDKRIAIIDSVNDKQQRVLLRLMESDLVRRDIKLKPFVELIKQENDVDCRIQYVLLLQPTWEELQNMEDFVTESPWGLFSEVLFKLDKALEPIDHADDNLKTKNVMEFSARAFFTGSPEDYKKLIKFYRTTENKSALKVARAVAIYLAADSHADDWLSVIAEEMLDFDYQDIKTRLEEELKNTSSEKVRNWPTFLNELNINPKGVPFGENVLLYRIWSSVLSLVKTCDPQGYQFTEGTPLLELVDWYNHLENIRSDLGLPIASEATKEYLSQNESDATKEYSGQNESEEEEYSGQNESEEEEYSGQNESEEEEYESEEEEYSGQNESLNLNKLYDAQRKQNETGQQIESVKLKEENWGYSDALKAVGVGVLGFCFVGACYGVSRYFNIF